MRLPCTYPSSFAFIRVHSRFLIDRLLPAHLWIVAIAVVFCVPSLYGKNLQNIARDKPYVFSSPPNYSHCTDDGDQTEFPVACYMMQSDGGECYREAQRAIGLQRGCEKRREEDGRCICLVTHCEYQDCRQGK